MYFNIIASGSKGNATLIANNNTLILIDLGITKTRLIEGLKEIGKDINDISACLITHDHTDHIRGIKFISPNKVYGLEEVISPLSHPIDLYKPFVIGNIKITPIPISHDASNGCGFVLEDECDKFVYITDTGMIYDEIYDYCTNPTYLMLESNHDIRMLLKTHRTMECKQRIMSDVGHLSNEDSAFTSLRIIGDRTKEIILAHISEEANAPEVALKAYQKIFMHAGKDINKYKITCAPQWHSYLGGDYEH